MIHLVFLFAAQQYDHGNPTNEEQLILEIINRARANPRGAAPNEETRLQTTYPSGSPTGVPAGWTLLTGLPGGTVVNPVPPLAFNSSLITSARGHSLDMWTKNYFDHFFPAGTIPPASTSTPQSRMLAAGYSFTGSWGLGENISSADPGDPTYLEDILMIDDSYPGAGHRVNLLDIGHASPYREIGLGYIDMGASKSNILRCVLTEDFARSDTGAKFIVGVVYWDLDGDGFYTPGEGLGGVTITVSAGTTFTAVTSSSGGYAIPFTGTGAVTVTATGLNLVGGSASAPVTLGAVNVKVDFAISTAAMPKGASNVMPTFWETAYGTNPNSDADGDTFTNLEEFLGGSDPTLAGSTPVPSPPPPPPPSGGGGGGGGKGGGCGLTGLEGALVLGLAAAIRRRRAAR